MSRKSESRGNSKKKHKSGKNNNDKKDEITSYDDIHHAISKNDSNTDFIALLSNIRDDQVLTGYGDKIHTLIYYAATKQNPNIKALKYLIKECKKRFNNNSKHNISWVLNQGHKSQNKKYQITPLSKILLTLRKEKLTNIQRLQYRHMALLLIGNGVDVNCKSLMEPHKDERKSSTDYQIVEPLQIAFSLYDPEIFLSIMFKNIHIINYKNNDTIQLHKNPLIDIQCKIHKLWYNQYNDGSRLNVVNSKCNDCSLAIFAEALRYLYILVPKTPKCPTKNTKSVYNIESVIDENMIRCYNDINNSCMTQLDVIRMYYHSPKTINNWLLGIHLTYNPCLSYHPCFDKKTYRKQRKGLIGFIAVLPKIYNLKQLHITWSKQKLEGDNEHCFELLRCLNVQCRKYGTINDIKLNGFNISTESMHWLSDSIINWKNNDLNKSTSSKWEYSLFGIITIGYLRNNTKPSMCMFPIDIVLTIYQYCLDKKHEAILQIKCGRNKFVELQRLSLINVGLNNKCIEQLCNAMKTSKVLKINKLILNQNTFNVVGLSTICRFIQETDCIYLNHLEIKNCHRLDFNRSHYPLQIFLLVMSCIKQYNLILSVDDECKDNNNENDEKEEENYDAICQCIFNIYKKYFVNQKYISHHLFPVQSPKLKRKKTIKRPASARTASTKTFFSSKSPKTFFDSESPSKVSSTKPRLPSLNQSTTQTVNANKLNINRLNKNIATSFDVNLFVDTLTITPTNEDIWNDTLNDIVTKCNKMSVVRKNEKNIYFDIKPMEEKEKEFTKKTIYRIPVIQSSKDLSTKLYFEIASISVKTKKPRNHSHDLQQIKETRNFLKYNAKNKYLYIHIESIENILIEFDRIKAFDFQYLYIKLSEKQNCSLILSSGDSIKIDRMLCVENAKQIRFDTNCKIQTTQMWLKNNKIIQIQPKCIINTDTSWYYKVNKIINKGTLKHIAHCFIDNNQENLKTLFKNENKIITNAYFYCNLNNFENNGQITSNVIHHIKSDRYQDNNGNTNVFGIAFYEINNICNINGNINGDVLLFDVKNEFILNSKSLRAQKHCFIHCNNQIKLEKECKIQFGRNDKQLTQHVFKQNHSKIFGYDYDKYTKLPSNKATPLLWFKSASLITNGAIIEDIGYKAKSNSLLKCVIAFDVEKTCQINNLHLSSNNKVYLLNTQNVKINSSTFNINEFYLNIMNDIQCKTNMNLNCINIRPIDNIHIESSTIMSNKLHIDNVNSIECSNDTNIQCAKKLIVNATEKVNVLNSKIKIINDMDDNKNETDNECMICYSDAASIIDITTPSLVIDNSSIDSINQCTVKFEVYNNCKIKYSNLSSNKMYLLKAQNIEIESSTIHSNDLYIKEINNIECKNNTNVYCCNIFEVNCNECKLKNTNFMAKSINNQENNVQETDAVKLIIHAISLSMNGCKMVYNKNNGDNITFDVSDSLKMSNSVSISSTELNILNAKDFIIDSSTMEVSKLFINKFQVIDTKQFKTINLSIKNSELSSKDTLQLFNTENIEIESSTIHSNELSMEGIYNVKCNTTNIYFKRLDVQNTNQFIMSNGCKLCMKSDDNMTTTDNISTISDCILNIKQVFSIEGVFIGNNIKITANECNINGTVASNMLSLIISERMRLTTKDSIEINDLFCIKLNGTDILLNNKDILIEPKNDSSVWCIDSDKSLLSMKNSKLTSKSKLDIFNIQTINIESSMINTNQAYIHDIDIVKCMNDTNIQCSNKFDMERINQYKMMSNSKLSMKMSSNFNDNINESKMSIENLFFLDNTSEIHCLFGYFDINCNNKIELNGKVFIDNEYCKFKIYSRESVIVGKTCQFQCNSVYNENNGFDDKKQCIMSNGIADNLNNLKNNSYIYLHSDKIIQINGNMNGNASLCIMDCHQEINVTEDSKLSLYCLLIKNATKTYFNGSFNNKYGKLSVCLSKSLNMDKKSNICSLFSSFYITENMMLKGNIKSDEIHVNTKDCDMRVDSIVANKLFLEIKKRLICSGTIRINTLGRIKCNECKLENINFMAESVNDKHNNLQTKDAIKLTVQAISLSMYNGKMIYNRNNDCNITFDVSNSLKISNSVSISLNELNILNAKDVIIESSTMEINKLFIKDINGVQLNKDSKIKCLNKVQVRNVNDFKMRNNCKLSVQYDGNCDDNMSHECIIQTNKLFFMDNETNIYCTFKYFEIRSNDKIEINGKIWINESCKVKMNSNNELTIAPKGEIVSQLNYVKQDKTKFLQKKRINKQDLLNVVNDNLQNDYYIHLYCDNVTNIYGAIVGKKSLIIIDANKEINIFDNGRINGGETYIRCMNNITFSGTIDNECGDCFIVANHTLHLKENGKICLLFLSYDGLYNVIDECYSKTAANMSMDDIDDKLSKINDRINNFNNYKATQLNEFSKKIKLENAKKLFKFYDEEINATIDRTGLNENNIGTFLKLMNKLLFMTLQQQEHLILLDVKLSKFITLINNEFDYKLSIETYFEEKNLSKFVSILKNADFEKLTKLICKDENEFENKILSILGTINMREKRELEKICLKPKIWQKYQHEKEKIVIQSVSEICPMLSLFFNEINDAMKQTQTKTLNYLQNNSVRSLEINGINTTKSLTSAAMTSLNIISNFKKNNQTFTENKNGNKKIELLICGFLRNKKNNHNLKSNVFEMLKQIIFNYLTHHQITNNGILKSKALTLITGIEECCSEIIGNQQQMTESILLAKSILKFKPKVFKKSKKKKQIKSDLEKRNITKQVETTKNTIKQQQKIHKETVVKEQENKPAVKIEKEKKKIPQQTQNILDNSNRCKKLLTVWRLIRYHDIMQEKGWQDPMDWYKLTDDHLKYHLNFKNGHIVRFKRKFKEWLNHQPATDKKGVNLCKELLTNWRLIQYMDQMLKKGWQEPTDWILLAIDDLKNELNFKPGHVVRFKRKHKEWRSKQQSKSKQKSKLSYKNNNISVKKKSSKQQKNQSIIEIKKRKRKKLDIDAIDSEQLWNVVEDGIGTILVSDVNAIKISIDYFAFFGKFQVSFDKFAKQESVLKRGWKTLTNIVSKNKNNVNDNMKYALSCLTKDIEEFSNIKNQFSITINELKEIAMECIEDCVKITPSSEIFKTAQINREYYQNIYLKKKEVYDSKVSGLNDEYNKLFTQKLRLCAQKSTLQYEIQQNKR